MDLMKILAATGAQDKILEAVAGQFGINATQANGVAGQVMGALMGGMQKQASQNGIQPLLKTLMKGNHGQVIDDPTQLAGSEAAGNEILGSLFGSKDVSRALAGQVEQNTGVSSSIVKKMLPVLATVVMGALSKNLMPSGSGGKMSGAAGLLGALGAMAGSKNAGLGSMAGLLGGALSGQGVPNKSGLSSLMNMLDADQDGNPLDDIMKMVAK